MNALNVTLVGNPNSGKTSLFNALTDSRQQIGNWPGVTVEQKIGYFDFEDHKIKVTDLPGIYHLSISDEPSAIDKKIAIEYLLSEKTDLLVNVIDATNLERNLYLSTQLLELNIPTLIAINMTDIAKKRGLQIDLNRLSQLLNCPVMPIIANKRQGIRELKQAILPTIHNFRPRKPCLMHQPTIKTAIESLSHQIEATLPQKHFPCFLAMRLLENNWLIKQKVNENILSLTQRQSQQIKNDLNMNADIAIADQRYRAITEIIIQTIQKPIKPKPTLTSHLDRLLLNKWLGIPIFLFVMYAIFLFAIHLGGIFQDAFAISSQAIFVHGTTQLLSHWHWPTWLTMIIANGIGKGISTTLTFIPIIAAMFFSLGLLETSGYLARACFIVDRLMCALGLPGKAFIPMMLGFGCNVPAIMAARTLDNVKDRILTIAMIPFMSCGARLAIYAIFAAAFFPRNGQNVVFLLYLIGILIAVLTGFLLRKTLLRGQQTCLVMEFPPYHLPHVCHLISHTWHQLKSFIVEAGKVIVLMSALISVLNIIPIKAPETKLDEPPSHSVLAITGKTITPILKPLGISSDNWPATVGLITGIVAKEVVIGTLNTLYATPTHKTNHQNFSITQALRDAASTISKNLSYLIHHPHQPIAKHVPQHLSQSIYGAMYKRFDGAIGAFAYLLFVLLYFPCVAAIATMIKELNWRWASFSMIWNTSIAYVIATTFYQIATFTKHVFFSTIWITSILILFSLTIFIFHKLGEIR